MSVKNTLTETGAWLLRGVLLCLSKLPLRFHYGCGRVLSWILKDVMHYRRELVMANLARSFPQMKFKELKKVSDRFYRHFGDIFAEAIWFGGCTDPERLRKARIVEFRGYEAFEEAFRNSPSVMLLTTHCGNWELFGGFEYYDYREDAPPVEERIRSSRIVSVYKTLSSKVWDKVMGKNRCAPLLRDNYDLYMDSTSILRYALSHRNEKLVYLFPTDQCPYKNSTVDETVDFMNQKTKTMLGGISLAHKLGMSVFYLNMTPVSRGHYEWTFTRIAEDASSMSAHDIVQTYYNLLQKDLEETPWNYLWTHNRWKK